jgi:uncharacterized membrane protein
MKSHSLQTTPIVIRASLLFFWGGVCAAFISAPWLKACGHFFAASMFRAIFSLICHQDPARSFTLLGHPWAVCHRCSGIYFGLFLPSLLPLQWNAVVHLPRYRRAWVIAATTPLLLDVLLPLAGLWDNTPASRLVTGVIFGCMLSSLLASALAEFMHKAPWKRTGMGVHAQGGLE